MSPHLTGPTFLCRTISASICGLRVSGTSFSRPCSEPNNDVLLQISPPAVAICQGLQIRRGDAFHSRAYSLAWEHCPSLRRFLCHIASAAHESLDWPVCACNQRFANAQRLRKTSEAFLWISVIAGGRARTVRNTCARRMISTNPLSSHYFRQNLQAEASDGLKLSPVLPSQHLFTFYVAAPDCIETRKVTHKCDCMFYTSC